MIYTVKRGETLDAICFRYYGQASGYVEKVLNANYRLARYGHELPLGLRIILPELKKEVPTLQMIDLWD